MKSLILETKNQTGSTSDELQMTEKKLTPRGHVGLITQRSMDQCELVQITQSFYKMWNVKVY
jgi:hypothetical protein